MQQTRPCSHVGFWIAIACLIAVLMFSFILNMALFIGLSVQGGTQTARAGKAEDQYPKFTERWSYGEGDVKVVRIAVQGAIFRETDESFFGVKYDKIESILRQIRAAENDEDVQAILLEVDSPGGDMTSTDEIYQELLTFRQSAPNRKIVVFVRDMAASGAYYVSAPADWIIAEPTAILGSIGVIMQTLNFKGLSEKIGVTDTTIKSVTNKDLLNPFHDVQPEQVALLQSIVNDLHKRFFSIVQTSRNIDAAKLKAMADGRIFTADTALKNGFIDQIGYWNDAANKVAQLLGQESVKIVRYERKPEFFEMLSEIRSPLGSPLTLSRLTEAGTPRFMYLWKP